MFRTATGLAGWMALGMLVPAASAADSLFAGTPDEFWRRADLTAETRGYADAGQFEANVGSYQGSSPIVVARVSTEAGETRLLFTTTRVSTLTGRWAGSDVSRTTISSTLLRQGVLKFQAFDARLGRLESVIVRFDLQATVAEDLWLCDTTVLSDSEAQNQGTASFQAWVAGPTSAAGVYPDLVGRELYNLSATTSSTWKLDKSCWYESWWNDIAGFLQSWVPATAEFFVNDVWCSLKGGWDSGNQGLRGIGGGVATTVAASVEALIDLSGVSEPLYTWDDAGEAWTSIPGQVDGIDTDCSNTSADFDLSVAAGDDAHTEATTGQTGSVTLTADEYYRLFRRSPACSGCIYGTPMPANPACATVACASGSDGWLEIGYSQRDWHELRYESGDEQDNGAYTTRADGWVSVEYVYRPGATTPVQPGTPVPIQPGTPALPRATSAM